MKAKANIWKAIYDNIKAWNLVPARQMRKFKGKLTEGEKVLKSVIRGSRLVVLGKKTQDIRKSKRGRTQRRGNVFRTLRWWMYILFANTRTRLWLGRSLGGSNEVRGRTRSRKGRCWKNHVSGHWNNQDMLRGKLRVSQELKIIKRWGGESLRKDVILARKRCWCEGKGFKTGVLGREVWGENWANEIVRSSRHPRISNPQQVIEGGPLPRGQLWTPYPIPFCPLFVCLFGGLFSRQGLTV